MKLFTLLCAAALTFACSAPRASAAPITYFESVSGDLPQSDPLPNFTLDIGLNTISGTIHHNLTQAGFDSFAFTVPAGLEVLSLKLISPSETGSISNTAWRLFAGSASLGGGTALEDLAINPPGFVFAVNVPLGPDTYNMAHFQMGGLNGSTADYTFIFDVHQPIPEPASLSLLALGAVGLLRRRRA